MTKILTPTDPQPKTPGSGEEWLDKWVRPPEQKRGILEHFANTIKEANKLGENIWSTSVLDNGITLNVCDHQMLKILRSTVDVTLLRKSFDSEPSRSEPSLRRKFLKNGVVDIKPFPRKSENDKKDPLRFCFCCSIDHKNFLKVIPLIEGEYQKALAFAVQKRGKIREGESKIKSGDGGWAGSHSYNFIRYLRGFSKPSDEKLPQPIYNSRSEPSEKLTNDRPNSSLDVEPKSGSEQVDGAQGELNSPPVVTGGAPANGNELTEAEARRKAGLGQETGNGHGNQLTLSGHGGAANEEPRTILDVEPELPGATLDEKVQRLLESGKLAEPKGNANPPMKVATSDEFLRNPQVIAWVLQNSNGVCALCESPAPFKNAKGNPYLEVHHVIPLSEKGLDMHTNAVALCPNCHRECHFGEDWAARKEQLYEKVVRLVKA